MLARTNLPWQLSDGAFFGETPILENSAQAELRRRTVTAMTDCKLWCLLLPAAALVTLHTSYLCDGWHRSLAVRAAVCTAVHDMHGWRTQFYPACHDGADEDSVPRTGAAAEALHARGGEGQQEGQVLQGGHGPSVSSLAASTSQPTLAVQALLTRGARAWNPYRYLQQTRSTRKMEARP
eukprot:COSAG01_NODE_6043_length_3882_cov_3.851042_2_plen_180_part_00